jgi:hypothetical protein
MIEPMSDRSERARDVLAAEAFAMPTPDPALHHGPVALPADPADPAGREAPHDVLAAEEFPMPAPRPGIRAQVAAVRRAPRPAWAGPAAAVVLVALLVRSRRR